MIESAVDRIRMYEESLMQEAEVMGCEVPEVSDEDFYACVERVRLWFYDQVILNDMPMENAFKSAKTDIAESLDYLRRQ